MSNDKLVMLILFKTKCIEDYQLYYCCKIREFRKGSAPLTPLISLVLSN